MFGENISHGLAAFNCQISHIHLERQFFDSWFRFQQNFQHFGFTVRIGREIGHPRAFCAFCQVVFLVACYAGYGKPFHVRESGFSVAVNGIVNCSFVVPFENGNVQRIFPDKCLFRNFGYKISPVAAENNNVVDIGTIAYKFLFSEACSHKSFLAVDIQFFIFHHHFRGLDVLETPDFGLPFAAFSVLAFQVAEPFDGKRNDVFDVVDHLVDFVFDGQDVFVGFILVEFQDTGHSQFH